ncbi:hypothetical protein BAE44_0004953 [Dichanthelium oligosanthes]|uniref:Uncharacterized protein n=1 Tax=Dichanthelium oligosanthes TaxID=888268 RepID=A0A1E5W9W1_9POAL|nr:hypothetical protein BAE44_0004953 [Dichanthelium oligosanthes]
MLVMARRSHRLHQLLSESRTAMLREVAAELTVTGHSISATEKIRKRCAVSPSGASSDRQGRALRLKRGVRLIGYHRRGGGTGTGASPCASSGRKRRMSESSWSRRHRHADVETRSTASARKLVSALWQLNKGDGAFEEEEVGWDAAAARRSSDHRRSASLEVSARHRVCVASCHSVLVFCSDRLCYLTLIIPVQFSKISRRKSKALKDDDEQRSWHNGHPHGQWFSDAISNGGTIEVHTCPQGRTPARPGGDRTAQVQDLYNSLTASAELVRVLANVLGPAGELSPTAASLLAALRSELDRARRLAKRQHGGGEEERLLRRQLAEEVRAWKARHREKAARLVASELDGERRSRWRAERVGKKLAEALADAEGSLRAATRELERERASRERLEKVCDELARGVDAGGTVAEEEEEQLRREAETAREELEREREMLQLADELREERVRMKLAEARIQFEEKNAVVDRLRQELEEFLGTSKDRQESPAHDEHRHIVDDHRSLQLVLASEFGVDGIDRVVTDKAGQEENGNEGEVDDGSEGSDIELNMDGNSWSYMTTSRATTAKNDASVHGSLSDRGTECGAGVGTFDRRSQGVRDALELQEWDDVCSDDRTSTKDLDEDAERYEAIKNLREQMLAGHGFVFLAQREADVDRDRHRHGLIPPIENGGLW